MRVETKEAAHHFATHAQECTTCRGTSHRMCDEGARLMAVFNRCVDAEMAADATAAEAPFKDAADGV